MGLNINQFGITTTLGQLDLEPGLVISGQVDAAQATALVPGQPVKMATTAGGVPKFISLASNTDKTFGFVVRNIKDINDPASSLIEVALTESVMYMNSGAAITRGANVEVVQATPGNVIASAGVNPVVGIAIDGATGANTLIRVLIKTPSTGNSFSPGVQTVNVTATLAQINAGLVLIPGVTAQKVTVLSFVARVLGTFATGTAVLLESTNVSPVLVATLAEAAIAGTGIVLPTTANVTLGAGYGAPLGTGDGLQVANSGSAQTGGTSIEFAITYSQS